MSDLGIPAGIRQPGEAEDDLGLTASERKYIVERFEERRRPRPEHARLFDAWLEQRRQTHE